MEHMRFPSWQSLCWDAIRGFDLAKSKLISVAEEAVLLRAEQIETSKDNDAEKLAINDALRSLYFLRRVCNARLGSSGQPSPASARKTSDHGVPERPRR